LVLTKCCREKTQRGPTFPKHAKNHQNRGFQSIPLPRSAPVTRREPTIESEAVLFCCAGVAIDEHATTQRYITLSRQRI
jgi:hypothetical protein